MVDTGLNILNETVLWTESNYILKLKRKKINNASIEFQKDFLLFYIVRKQYDAWQFINALTVP